MILKRRHVHQEMDRWGNIRVYMRVGHGPRIRLRETPGSEEFDKRYHELLRRHTPGELKRARRDAPKPGTLRWLGNRYVSSQEFRNWIRVLSMSRD